MMRAWGVLFRLYPSEHRSKYGEEMRLVLEQAAEAERERGLFQYVRFLAFETIGLLGGS